MFPMFPQAQVLFVKISINWIIHNILAALFRFPAYNIKFSLILENHVNCW